MVVRLRMFGQRGEDSEDSEGSVYARWVGEFIKF